jgi:hypothetical protein
MPVTLTPPSRPATGRNPKAPTRPVRNVLLELAYQLHATRVVGHLPAHALAAARS